MAGARWSALFPENPYDGFPVGEWDIDLQGWGSKDPLFGQLIDLVAPEVIIEVGSWKGASAVHMAAHAKAAGLSPTVVCVDTWLGSPEHFLKRDHPAYWESLNVRNGYPRLFEQFLANILHTGHDDLVVPLPQTSENAAVILRKLGIRADLIYIDAAHEYEPVLADLERYWRLVTDRGLLFGDDFKYEPVANAARDFTERRGLVLRATDKKFVVARDGEQLSALFG